MITYSDISQIDKEQLKDLFLSVNWQSGKYPDKLQPTISNYKTVYTAWDENKLIGLVSAMDDGVMTAYVHYLLVRPEYQKMGVGKRLMEMIKEHYKDYLKICLIAENDAIAFYEACGMKKVDTASPMYISKL